MTVLRLAAALALPLLMIAAAPARAEPPNPCDHYLPTGQALPRESAVRGSSVVNDEPTWRGRRVGNVRTGDHVEILKECGRQVMIRIPDGTTGWIPTMFLPSEEALARQARNRPAVTDQDCELRYDAGPLVDNCKTALAARKAREEELAHSVYLKGDPLRAFVSGKTLTITGRPGPSNEASREPVTTVYFEANGEAFMSAGSGQSQLWRGRWFLKDDKLCLDVRQQCSDVRRIPSGQVITSAPRGEYIVTAEDGDAKGLVAQVSAEYPYPRPLPVPAGLEAVAHPVMGW